MDTPFRNNKLYVPSGTRPQIELDAAPFQYCFLVGGVNDRGDHVRHSEDLYERTADFLFMNVTTPIGDTLVAHEVENRSLERHNGSKAFAAFGSFSMALPQARNIQKYLLMMGRELLDDVLEEEPKQLSSRGAKELFESIGEFIEASNLAAGIYRSAVRIEIRRRCIETAPETGHITRSCGCGYGDRTARGGSSDSGI